MTESATRRLPHFKRTFGDDGFMGRSADARFAASADAPVFCEE
jgi:hypothetical protein